MQANLAFILGLLVCLSAQASDSAKKGGGSGGTSSAMDSTTASRNSPDSNAEDATTKTFTDKVKSIRVYGDDYDVFFVNNGGPYEVPFSLPGSKNKDLLPDEILGLAHKNGTPITVTVDLKSEALISIDSQISREPSSEKEVPLPKELDPYKEILDKYK